MIDAVLLRPLPFPDAGRLVTVFNTYPKAGVDRDGSSLTNYYERRGRIPAFASLAIYRYGTAIVGEPGATEREQITRVSPDFFATLGLGPAMGRAFTEEETTFQTDNVAILTDAYWRQHFNADPHVIGRQIRVDGISENRDRRPAARASAFSPPRRGCTFRSSSRPEDRAPRERHSGGNVTQMIARLKPGATLAQAQAQIDAQNATLEADDPQAKMMADAGFRSLVVPLHADHVAGIRPTLLLLQAGALALLLIGAVNLVNLLLIRASGRVKEMAVRQALGASRRHVVSEVVVETTLLTLAGGLARARPSAPAEFACWPCWAPIVCPWELTSPSTRAWRWSRWRSRRHGHRARGAHRLVQSATAISANALQSETRGGTTGRAAQSLRHGFIVAQIALAFVLLAGAGLLGLSLQACDGRLSGLPAGPRSHRADLAALEKISRLAGRPCVHREAAERTRPPAGSVGRRRGQQCALQRQQRQERRHGEGPRPPARRIAARPLLLRRRRRLLPAMGFSLREGRFLTAADSRRAERVCVVDEDFARYYWPQRQRSRPTSVPGSRSGPAMPRHSPSSASSAP